MVSRRTAWRMAKLVVAAALIAALVRAADWREVAGALERLERGWVAIGLLLFVPQTLVSAARWRALAAPLARLSLGAAVHQTLAASAMNLVLPAKLGDLSKAAMLPLESSSRGAATVCAAVEKVLDVAVLLLLMGGGVVFTMLAAGQSSGRGREAVEGLYESCGEAEATPAVLLLAACATVVVSGRRPRRWWIDGGLGKEGQRAAALRQVRWAGGAVYRVVGFVPGAIGDERLISCRAMTGAATLSVALWLLHLAQIDCFLRAAGVEVAWCVVLARVPAALFAGLVPVAYCGIGPRDAALVALFADVASQGAMVAVGLLTSLRYLLPGAAGIPLLMAMGSGRKRATGGDGGRCRR